MKFAVAISNIGNAEDEPRKSLALDRIVFFESRLELLVYVEENMGFPLSRVIRFQNKSLISINSTPELEDNETLA